MYVDIDFEYKVLASVLNNPNLLTLDKDLFTDERTAIYQAMLRSYQQYHSLEVDYIARETRVNLAKLLAATPVEDVTPLTEQLKKLQKKRQLLEISEQIKLESTKDNPSLDSAFDILFSDSQNDLSGDLGQTIQQFSDELETKEDGRYEFISTGLKALDVMLGGEWPKQKVSIIMGDPGSSKTALVGNSMIRMAKRGHRSCFFSLEMSKVELVQRWLSELSEIDSLDLKTGKLTEDEKQTVRDAQNTLNSLSMIVYDDPSLSPDQMYALIRKHAKQGVKVFFIDYLQIVDVGDDRNAGLGVFTKNLKALAKKLDIHICIISQKNGKDGVWSIRDSGNVPANVDIIISLEPLEDTDIRTVNIEFRKNRSGKLGTIPTIFYAKYTSYQEG